MSTLALPLPAEDGSLGVGVLKCESVSLVGERSTETMGSPRSTDGHEVVQGLKGSPSS